MSKAFKDWLEARVKVGDGDCMVWTRACTGAGHPAASYKGSVRSVRVLVVEYQHRRIVGTSQVITTCGNRLCVASGHLRLVSRSEMQKEHADRGEMQAKFAACPKRRMAAPARKIDMETAREIRRRIQSGGKRQDLAAEFGISKNAISRIWTGKAWRELAAAGSVFAWRPAA